jgi:hypothetical protein
LNGNLNLSVNLSDFEDVKLKLRFNIVTHVPIARQRLGKHIPEVTFSAIGHPFLANGPIYMHF